MNVNATPVSITATGAWEDISGLPSNIEGAFFEVTDSLSDSDFGFRPDGNAAYNGHYANIVGSHSWAACGAVSDVVEGQRGSSTVDFYLYGTVDSDSVVASYNAMQILGIPF